MEGKRIIVSLFLSSSPLRINYSWNGRGTCYNAVYIVSPLSTRAQRNLLLFFFILLFFGSTLRLRWIFIESEISFLAPAPSSIIKRKISSGGREQILDAALPGIPSGSCRIGVGPIMLQSFATATQLSPRFSCGISTKTLVREEKTNPLKSALPSSALPFRYASGNPRWEISMDAQRFPFLFLSFFPLEFGKLGSQLAFQIQWKVRAQLSVTAESCFCPFFRLLARVHSIPFRLVCAGRGRRGSVCGVDRSISRMKDRVNENKWYFQRLFDSDFFFFFFFVSADSREYSWMKTKITSSPFFQS